MQLFPPAHQRTVFGINPCDFFDPSLTLFRGLRPEVCPFRFGHVRRLMDTFAGCRRWLRMFDRLALPLILVLAPVSRLIEYLKTSERGLSGAAPIQFEQAGSGPSQQGGP
jgi:hypothetical protein